MSDDRDRAVLSDQQLANVRLGHDYTKPHGDCLTCRVLATMDAALTKVRRETWKEAESQASKSIATCFCAGTDAPCIACMECARLQGIFRNRAREAAPPGPSSPPPEFEEAVKEHQAAICALERLLACYRTGGQPSQRLFAELDRTRAIREAAMKAEQRKDDSK